MPSAEQAVIVPVSTSDLVTMFFKAKEGVGDLKVQNLVGIASAKLTQQTTVQATGVASTLVEIIQSAGCKVQTLSLSFEDEEDGIN